MRITFLIGNGFDLGAGLKTDYSSFYKSKLAPLKSAGTSNELIAALSPGYYSWGEMETALGQFESKNSVDDFLLWKDELETLLEEYMAEQQELFAGTFSGKGEAIAESFVRSTTDFYDGLQRIQRDNIEKTISQIGEKIQYSFINFNYTDAFDRYLMMTRSFLKNGVIGQHKHSSMIFADTLDRLVHVHGTMGSGIVLGVNDESQIANEAWQSDYTAQRLLIKENIDDILGQARIKTAEKMIDQSRIVCVYGMSLSATDRNWWNYIYRWLMSNSDRRLLLFAYDEKNSNRVTAYRTFMNMYSTQNRFKEIIDIPDREWESVKNRIFARSSSGMFSVASIEGETSGSEA